MYPEYTYFLYETFGIFGHSICTKSPENVQEIEKRFGSVLESIIHNRKIEGKIIEGGCKTFEDSRLKSILVELDENQPDITRPAISTIEQAGLKLSTKKRVSMLEGSQFASVYNYFFCRS